MYQTFATRIQDLVGTAVSNNPALTEWLSEEAMNAINIMSPQMLISASSTHRLTESEQLNDVGRNTNAEYDTSATTIVLTAGTFSNVKVGSILAFKYQNNLISERVKVLSKSGSNLTVQRAVNGTTAQTIPSASDVYVVLEKSFNTRKFKLLEVNRDGYSAKLIPSGFVKKANDPNSIHFASKRSPAYYIKSGNIHIRPLVNGYEQGEIIGLTYPTVKHDMKSTTDLPVQAEEFIVIGAARKYLIRLMTEEYTQIPAAVTLPTLPNAPTVADNQIGNLGTAPAYTAPTISGDASDLTNLEDLDTDNTIDVHADQIEYDQWFSTVGHFIEDEEDVELASAQLQKIATYLNAYSQQMQNQLNIFNDANVEYQAELQKAIENARLSSQDDAQKLQLYQAELQEYGNELNAKVQVFTSGLQKTTTKYNWYNNKYEKLTLMYNEKAQILRGVQPQ